MKPCLMTELQKIKREILQELKAKYSIYNARYNDAAERLRAATDLLESIGESSGDVIEGVVNSYLEANPPIAGATKEQAAQIEANKAAIASLEGKPSNWENITGKPGVFPPDAHEHSEYLRRNEDAVNSLKLGGKSPEYYSHPNNLIINSDFLIYDSDVDSYPCWFIPDNATLAIDANGVKTFTSNNGYKWLRQSIFSDGREVGKPYTLAITLEDGTRLANSGIAPQPNAAYQMICCSIKPDSSTEVFLVTESDGEFALRINAKIAGASIRFKHIDLFEGLYPYDSVPPHVPKGYAAELLTCQVAKYGVLMANDSAKLGGKAPEYYLQPRNLLDNSDFRNPVNQRGVTWGTACWTYFIDRWVLVSVSGGNVTFDINTAAKAIGFSTSNGETFAFIQRFPKGIIDITKTYTLAYKVKDGSVVVKATSFETGSESFDALNIWLDSGTYLEWAALYEGSYTAETLPPYVEPDPVLELAKCQYYANVIEVSAYGRAGLCKTTQGENACIWMINTPPMRPGGVPSVKMLEGVVGDLSVEFNQLVVTGMSGFGVQSGNVHNIIVNLSGNATASIVEPLINRVDKTLKILISRDL